MMYSTVHCSSCGHILNKGEASRRSRDVYSTRSGLKIANCDVCQDRADYERPYNLLPFLRHPGSIQASMMYKVKTRAHRVTR